MSIIISHFSNSSQQLSTTQEAHVSWLVQALVLEEKETVRINALADPVRRRCAKQEQTRLSQLTECAFLVCRTSGRMTTRTVYRTVFQAFQLGYIVIQDTSREPNPFLSEEEAKREVAERFHQWSQSRKPPRQVTGFRLLLTETGRTFGQTLRAAWEVPDE